MGKVHMGMARSGKVKNQTPRVPKDKSKRKKPNGRAGKRVKRKLHDKKAREEVPFKEAIFSEMPEPTLTSTAKVGASDPVEEFLLRTAVAESLREQFLPIDNEGEKEKEEKEKGTEEEEEEEEEEQKENEPTSHEKPVIVRDILKSMLERENAIRFSEEIQEKVRSYSILANLILEI